MLQLPYATYRPAPVSLADLAPPTGKPRPAGDAIIRLLDLTIAAVALFVLAPIMLLVSLLIVAGDGASPLFVQQRLGRGGSGFGCLKFRTMIPDAEHRLALLLAGNTGTLSLWRRDQKLAGDPRITPLGHLLRIASIDELPQLLNVLAGHMSLVGPRPIVAAEVGRYGRRFATYCDRRPGITGLWQVTGRSRAGYDRRLACDRLFARRRSVALYLRILAATVPAVLLARGAC